MIINMALLQKFCSTHPDKLDKIGSPFTLGDKTYATDARVIIEVKSLYDVPVNPLAPQNIDAVLGRFVGPCIRRLPSLPAIVMRDCNDCEGLGKEWHANCSDCCGHFCKSCNGTGKVEKDKTMVLGNKIFNCRYLRLISELPDLKYNPAGTLEQPMSFTFMGGRGLLMGMTYEIKESD